MGKPTTGGRFVLPEEKGLFVLPEERGEFVLPEEKEMSLGDQLLAGPPAETTPEPSPLFPREGFTPERFPEVEMAPALTLSLPGPREEWQGLDLPLASPEEIESQEGLLKQIRRGKKEESLVRSMRQIQKEMADLTLPGGKLVDDYGKRRIQEAKDVYVPPAFLGVERVKEIDTDMQNMLDRLNLNVDEVRPKTDKPPPMSFSEQMLYHANPAVLDKPEKEERQRLHDIYETDVTRYGQKGFETAMDAMDAFFNAPVRAMAEAVDMAREGASYAARGMEGPAPELSFGRIGKAIMMEEGASRSFGDTFTKAYEQAKGDNPTMGENLVLAGLGTVADVMTGGWSWGKVSPFASRAKRPKEARGKFFASSEGLDRPATAQTAVEENVQAVFDKFPLTSSATPQDVRHIAINTARQEATPNQIRTVRKLVRRFAIDQGATNKQLREIDALLIKRIGEQGKNLTRSGKLPDLQRSMFPLTDARVERIQKPGPMDLPFGAGQQQGPIARAGQALRSAFSADRGMPKSAQRITRKNESEALAGIYQAHKDARTLDRLYAPTREAMSGERGKNLMRFQSRASLLQRAERGVQDYRTQAGAFRAVLDEAAPAVDKALARGDLKDALGMLGKLETQIRAYKNPSPRAKTKMRGGLYWTKRGMAEEGGGEAGRQAARKMFAKLRTQEEKALAWVEGRYQRAVDMMEEAVRKGWGPQNENDRNVLKFLEETFAERWDRERVVGVSGRIGKYIPQIETRESAASQIAKTGAKRAGGSKKGFMKPRLDWTHLSTVEGSKLRKFEQEPGKILAARLSGGMLAEAAAKNERDLLEAFGTRLESLGKANPKKVAAGQEAAIKEAYGKQKNQQVAIHTQVYGPGRGTRYVIDQRIADVIDRSMNPEKISKWWNLWYDVNNWWKSMATVGRPQFLFRNLFLGNFMNMWLGGVDISLFKDAMKMIDVKNKTGLSSQLKGKGIPRSTFDHDFTLDTIIHGKTVREWIKEGGEAKVFAPGKYEMEAGTQGNANMSLSPLSRNNPVNYMVGKANNAVEQASKLAVLMDTRKKGGQVWEGAEKAAELLFNVDELSAVAGSGALKKAGGFYKWAYKNLALQFISMLKRPGRLSQYYSWRSGIENLDPTAEEFDLATKITPEMRETLRLQKRTMSKDARKKGLFWEPFVRGEEGGRKVFQGAAAIPMDALEQFGWENLLNGKYSDFALSALGGLTDYLGAAPGMLYKGIALKQTGKLPTFGGSSINSPAERFAPAPPYLETVIQAIKAKDPELYDRLKNDMNWITPEIVWGPNGPLATGKTKVSKDFLMTIEAVDPQFSVLRRISSDLGSILFLGKSGEITQDVLMNQGMRRAQETQEILRRERVRQTDAGERPSFD